MKYLEDVHAFHSKFKIPQPRTCAEPLDDETERFRVEFLREELAEYEMALARGDRETQLDSLVDLVYVALGTALMHGFDFDEAWRRVQAANMAKQCGVPSGRHGTLDVTKPPGWVPPDHSDLVSPSYIRPPLGEEGFE